MACVTSSVVKSPSCKALASSLWASHARLLRLIGEHGVAKILRKSRGATDMQEQDLDAYGQVPFDVPGPMVNGWQGGWECTKVRHGRAEAACATVKNNGYEEGEKM